MFRTDPTVGSQRRSPAELEPFWPVEGEGSPSLGHSQSLTEQLNIYWKNRNEKELSYQVKHIFNTKIYLQVLGRGEGFN